MSNKLSKRNHYDCIKIYGIKTLLTLTFSKYYRHNLLYTIVTHYQNIRLLNIFKNKFYGICQRFCAYREPIQSLIMQIW